MRKYAAALCIGALLCTASSAQTPWKFRSDNYLGLLSGEAGNYGQLQTVSGLYKKSWFLGLGAGLDYYRYRSIPLFLAITKDLMPAKNGLFVSLEGGTNVPRYERNLSGTNYVSSKFYGGPYWSAGLGYKLKLSAHSDNALLVSVGYSYKEMKEGLTAVIYDMCPILGPCNVRPTPIPDRYDYRNRRASVEIGWQF